MALPIIGTIFKIAKNIIAPKIAQALDLSKPLNKEEIVDQVLSKAQELAESDKEIELALIDFEKSMQGTYAELSTKIEKIIRSVAFHLITFWACGMITWSAVSHNALDPKVLTACLLIIVGRVGHRAYKHFKEKF